jgi:hypothetical protein
MTAIKEILKNLPSQTRGESSQGQPMGDPEYLRKSAKLINDALSKGMDVLQLENGDIVTTGMKVVVTKYRWDTEASQMVKVNSRAGRRRRLKAEVDA